MKFLAVIPQGFEEEASNELIGLGAEKVILQKGIISFDVNWSAICRIHLFARLPFRLFRVIAEFVCDSPESLYLQVKKSFDWNLWLHPSKSFRVDVSGISPGLTHTHFSALQVKNAIVDLQREHWGNRSNINLDLPDFSLHLHLNRGNAVLSLSTSAQSLHRRGYKSAMGLAPIKENLASGLLLKTGWKGSVPLVDPLCGSGTFLIEAASMQLGIPIGLNRTYLFENWIDFDHLSWEKEKNSAVKLEYRNNNLPIIIGCENNIDIAKQANSNIHNASLESFINIKNIHFEDLKLPKQKGILICNPPYGKRIGDEDHLSDLYLKLGDFCKKNASGWQLWVLSGNAKLTKFLKMKSSIRFPVSNGGIDCRWLKYEIN
tara:strand:- start:543 stop:1667 length:1125 start_codon:yes stop_codon:yes gene_type:complete